MAGLRGGAELDVWLTPFLAVMGRKTRRTWAPPYLRGLLGPGGRKSLQPMAARLGLSGHDQLQHFIASPAWDDAPLWRVLAEAADRLVGGPDAVLVIDDTALPKKGELSVGVARQYCGQLGKRANCQALVSLTLARGEVPLPVALRLFLPEEWTRRAIRRVATGRVCRRPRLWPAAGARSRWPNSTACRLQACASAPCWPTQAMARAPSSGRAWIGAGWPGRSASPAIRRSMGRAFGSRRLWLRVPASLCRMRSRARRRGCWLSYRGGA